MSRPEAEITQYALRYKDGTLTGNRLLVDSYHLNPNTDTELTDTVINRISSVIHPAWQSAFGVNVFDDRRVNAEGEIMMPYLERQEAALARQAIGRGAIDVASLGDGKDRKDIAISRHRAFRSRLGEAVLTRFGKTPPDFLGNRGVYIAEMDTLPGHQRRGIGSAMLFFATEQYRSSSSSRGFVLLHEVRGDYHDTSGWYDRLGFETPTDRYQQGPILYEDGTALKQVTHLHPDITRLRQTLLHEVDYDVRKIF